MPGAAFADRFASPDGVAYLDAANIAPLPLERLAVGDVSWWSVVGAESFASLPTSVELKPGAQRYDAHEPASFNNLMPLAESLRLLLEATPALVAAHARALGDRLLAGLPPGFSPASPDDPAARSAADVDRLLAALAETP